MHDRAGARASAAEAWRAGARSLRTAGIYAAAVLPPKVLALLHRVKRLGS